MSQRRPGRSLVNQCRRRRLVPCERRRGRRCLASITPEATPRESQQGRRRLVSRRERRLVCEHSVLNLYSTPREIVNRPRPMRTLSPTEARSCTATYTPVNSIPSTHTSPLHPVPPTNHPRPPPHTPTKQLLSDHPACPSHPSRRRMSKHAPAEPPRPHAFLAYRRPIPAPPTRTLSPHWLPV